MEGLGTISKFRYLWFPNLGNLFLFAHLPNLEGLASFSVHMSCWVAQVGFWIPDCYSLLIFTKWHFPGSGRFDFPTAAAMGVLVVPLWLWFCFGF